MDCNYYEGEKPPENVLSCRQIIGKSVIPPVTFV